jgi:hypothetical protein
MALLVCASPAWAQVRTPARPAQNKPGIRLFIAGDQLDQSASKTFNAVFGKDKLIAFGAGVDVVNIFKHAFLRVGATRTSVDGERVVVVQGQATKLGIPLHLTMTPLEIGAGWRFTGRSATQLVTPYIGGGAVMLGYKETSDFAESNDNTDKSFNGFGVFGGVDVRITKMVGAGGEFHYRSIKNALGEAGASKEFNEKDLGGTVIRVHIALRF